MSITGKAIAVGENAHVPESRKHSHSAGHVTLGEARAARACPNLSENVPPGPAGESGASAFFRTIPISSGPGRAQPFYSARRSALVVCCIVLAIAGAAGAAIPGADNKKAFTGRDYQKAVLAYNQRTLTQAYKENGEKDPKWDAAAIRFLDAMALHFTNSGGNDWTRLPGGITQPELLKLADAAVDAGCNDALVVYCRAVLLDDAKHPPAEVGPLVQAAAEQMFEGKYPVNRALAAQRRMYRLTDPRERARREQVLDGAYDLAVALVVHWKYADIDQRIIFGSVWDDVRGDGLERRTKFVEEIRAAGDAVDPWMRHMILGSHEVRLAWEARGGGYANTVSPQGWQGFHDHLKKASEHLAAAHEAQPKFPEAATEMMEIALGESGELRPWFDKAVTAQFDYYPAYSKMLWSLRPRWFGTHEEMYAFGVECLQTRRFDTHVPAVLLTALNDIADDAESAAFYKQPGVYENVNEYFTGQIAQGGTFAEPYYPSYHGAFAWRCGRYDEARKLFDALGESVNERPFLNFDVMGRLAISHAYAMRDGLSQTVSAAERQAAGGDLAGASGAYEKAAASLEPDDKARYYLRSRQKQLQWQQKFNAGEWVDITPDKDFIGWQPINGQWTVNDDGSVEGVVVDPRGCWMLCQANFLGGDFEVEMTLELPEDDRGSVAGGVGFANVVDLTKYWGLFVRRTPGGTVTLNRDFIPAKRDPVELQPRNTLTLKVQSRQISGDFNGKEMFRDYPVDYIFNSPRRYLGIGNRQNNPDSRFRLIGLRVRSGDGGG